MNQTSDIGVIGLAVMGANLALNLNDAGNGVSVYNRTTSVTDDFMTGPAANKGIAPAATLEELVSTLGSPRVVLLMVKAGAAVDAVIADLVPLLDDGDMILDGGNSKFTDTERRWRELSKQGIGYLGVGFSGGEEGARHGAQVSSSS